jgi:sulfonate transport system substrate-binding protein
VAFALTLGVSGCGNSQSTSVTSGSSGESATSESSDTDKKVVRIGAVGQGNSLLGAIGIADSKGWLAEELEKVGYEPEIVGFAQAGPAINEAFAAGEIDTAIYGDLPATVAKSNGTDTTIFATYNYEEQMGIFVRDGVDDVKSAKDLPGHKVIVAKGTIYQQYFKAVIEDAGLKEDDIEQINTFSDATSLISSGDADVLITSTSIAYYLESLGYGKLVEDSTKNEEWSSQFFGVGLTDYLKENPEAAKAIIKAMLRGQEFIKENPEEAYELWAEKSDGYTAEIYEKVYAYDTSFDYISPEITDATVKKLNNLNDFLVSEELISSAVDMESFVDNSYYEAAKKEYDAEQK